MLANAQVTPAYGMWLQNHLSLYEFRTDRAKKLQQQIKLLDMTSPVNRDAINELYHTFVTMFGNSMHCVGFDCADDDIISHDPEAYLVLNEYGIMAPILFMKENGKQAEYDMADSAMTCLTQMNASEKNQTEQLAKQLDQSSKAMENGEKNAPSKGKAIAVLILSILALIGCFGQYELIRSDIKTPYLAIVWGCIAVLLIAFLVLADIELRNIINRKKLLAEIEKNKEVIQQSNMQQGRIQQNMNQQSMKSQNISLQSRNQQSVNQQNIPLQSRNQQSVNQQNISQQNISQQNTNPQNINTQSTNSQNISTQNITQQSMSQPSTGRMTIKLGKYGTQSNTVGVQPSQNRTVLQQGQIHTSTQAAQPVQTVQIHTATQAAQTVEKNMATQTVQAAQNHTVGALGTIDFEIYINEYSAQLKTLQLTEFTKIPPATKTYLQILKEQKLGIPEKSSNSYHTRNLRGYVGMASIAVLTLINVFVYYGIDHWPYHLGENGQLEVRAQATTADAVEPEEERSRLVKGYDTLAVQDVEASSELKVKKTGKVYSGTNVIDNDVKTCWQDGIAGDGIGETLTFHFDLEDAVAGFEIVNGCVTSKQKYYNNSRLSDFTLSCYDIDGELVYEDEFHLEDKFNKKPVRVMFSDGQAVDCATVVLTINDVYEGKKYKDTCLSEVSFIKALYE